MMIPVKWWLVLIYLRMMSYNSNMVLEGSRPQFDAQGLVKDQRHLLRSSLDEEVHGSSIQM